MHNYTSIYAKIRIQLTSKQRKKKARERKKLIKKKDRKKKDRKKYNQRRSSFWCWRIRF